MANKIEYGIEFNTATGNAQLKKLENQGKKVDAQVDKTAQNAQEKFNKFALAVSSAVALVGTLKGALDFTEEIIHRPFYEMKRYDFEEFMRR